MMIIKLPRITLRNTHYNLFQPLSPTIENNIITPQLKILAADYKALST